ncbi:hypothetical protein ACFS5L_12535 [Streptomyces phyllanthi]|uniref:Lipoprotein n=1 Tax=Streptomyces phyllanthi TaxID=1803180 RepID=A0A5N8WFJ9_9ACTN|nr:hypothetical protein [Streptomyces phyllanthi]MPY46261.1 hypothetical protein [Streptomyces phyllanthi]
MTGHRPVARRLAPLCTAAAAALLLSPATAHADHVDDPSAQELSDAAEKAFDDATSMRLTMTDRSEGTDTSTGQPTTVDLALDQDDNCTGTIEMGGDGGSAELIKRGEEVWLKPDETYWRSQFPDGGQEVADLLQGRYLHGTSSDALLTDMAGVCDLRALQEDATGDGSANQQITKGNETTVDGERVTPLTSTEGGTTTTLYVLSGGDHRLVRGTEKGGGSDVTTTFTDYNEPVPSQTPSADESLDVSQLESELQNV